MENIVMENICNGKYFCSGLVFDGQLRPISFRKEWLLLGIRWSVVADQSSFLPLLGSVAGQAGIMMPPTSECLIIALYPPLAWRASDNVNTGHN